MHNAHLKFTLWLHSQTKLSGAEIRHILSYSISKRIRKKEYLLNQGEVCRNECFVARGCLRLFRIGADTDEHILRFAVENWWIKDQESMVLGLPSNYNIDALEDTDVLLWSVDSWHQLTEELPLLKNAVEKLLTKRDITNQNRIYDAISASAEGKYENFIKNYPSIFLRVPVYMIASYLGVSSKTLTRIWVNAAKAVK